MTDFSHLSQLQVTSTQTAVFEFYRIKGTPKMTVKPATEINKPFYNALLKRGKRTAKIVKSGLNADVVAAHRNEDRELYVQHIIVGWEGIQDAQGNQVEFSKENCKSFLEQLPNSLFDDLRDFASDEANFIEDGIDIEEVSKN